VLIDWFTVIAQILNFLILVFLLKHFLYDRIIQAMDKRNDKIRSRLEEADQKEKEATEKKEAYLRKNREIEEKEESMLSEARQKADARRKELTAQAKEHVEALRKRWQEALEKEKDTFFRDLRHMVGQKVYAVTRRALKDLAKTDVEKQAVELFLEHIQRMEEEQQKQLTDAIQRSNNQLTVRTSFEADSRLRRQITKTLREQLAKDLQVNYEAKPEMIFGIELGLQGQKVSWHVEDYLETLEEEMKGTLEGYVQERQAEQLEGKGRAKEQ